MGIELTFVAAGQPVHTMAIFAEVPTDEERAVMEGREPDEHPRTSIDGRAVLRALPRHEPHDSAPWVVHSLDMGEMRFAHDGDYPGYRHTFDPSSGCCRDRACYE